MNQAPLDFAEWLAWRSHLGIAHHTPGRLRLKLRGLAPAAADPKRIEAWIAALPGVLDLRINPLAMSAVVGYDAKIITPADLLALLQGDESAARAAWRRLFGASPSPSPAPGANS